MRPRTYHLITYGCQMNRSDSERIRALLDSVGLAEVEEPEEAGLIVFNTCSVRQTAEDRVFGKLRDFEGLKRDGRSPIVAVTGCLPGRDQDRKIRSKMPSVDLYFPIRDLPQLPRWLAEVDLSLTSAAETPDDYLDIRPGDFRSRSAFVPIQTGCDKYCTYCVVPYARGRERHRPVSAVLDEIRGRTAAGAVEITLLGQSVNGFRADDRSAFSRENPYTDDFAALLWEVNRIPGVERLHFTAAHPLHMSDEVIDALALPKHVNYLHLPVQSGSDEVLRRMNRRYTAGQYLEVIRKVRDRRPGIALGTDIIVGFCGETERQFQETVELYREADFDISYTAMYSPRSGTAARKFLEDDVPREEKRRRWRELQRLMEVNTLRKNRSYLGQVVQVLVDSHAAGQLSGNSREMKRVRLPGKPDRIGETMDVRIESVQEWQLIGQTAEGSAVPKETYGQEKATAA
ncbi:hypothetical protein AMJ57_02715 [Parcubacteria bacterium SG8_24]|nr:MAG: hypothetical protein AMJ57_02715 [Parcubacteria bacterium SG8_24]